MYHPLFLKVIYGLCACAIRLSSWNVILCFLFSVTSSCLCTVNPRYLWLKSCKSWKRKVMSILGLWKEYFELICSVLCSSYVEINVMRFEKETNLEEQPILYNWKQEWKVLSFVLFRHSAWLRERSGIANWRRNCKWNFTKSVMFVVYGFAVITTRLEWGSQKQLILSWLFLESNQHKAYQTK